tara:strand:+ start:8488 stop:9186 length:699 start_codon:yes stop_codon:yes gene_type:complete
MNLISVIIPVYNEEKTILQILEKINKININEKLEIIIINDGSNDNSKKIIEENSHLYHRLNHIDQNCGKGKAIIEGLKISTGDYVFFQDADLEYDPQDLISFIDIVKKNQADLIMGSRFISDQRSVLHFWHMLGNKIITSIFNILNNTTFTDIYCCYIFFKRNNLNVEKLSCFGWGQQAEILTYLVLNSKKIYENAVKYDGRKYSEGKKIKFYHVIDVFYYIILTKLKTLIK